MYPTTLQAEVTPVDGCDPHVGLHAVVFRAERPRDFVKMSLTDKSHWLSNQADSAEGSLSPWQ